MSSDVIASVALQVKTADALAQIGKFENRLGALKQSAASVGAAVAALFAQRKAFDFASSLVKEASNVQEACGNELLTEAAILEASTLTLTGERKEAFDAFAESVADAGTAASETLADIAKEQSASDFNQALRAAKDDGTKIAALCRERIATR